MNVTVTISIDAARYADSDDCLADAERDYCAEHGLDGWDLEARWEDDNNRETILLTVPVSKAWANERWSAVNDAGDGYAPDADDVDAAVDALVEEGGQLVRRAEADDDVAVVLTSYGSLVAIGDANGAWACEIG